jgi:hypothetical protein
LKIAIRESSESFGPQNLKLTHIDRKEKRLWFSIKEKNYQNKNYKHYIDKILFFVVFKNNSKRYSCSGGNSFPHTV